MNLLMIMVYASVTVVACLFVRQALGLPVFSKVFSARPKEAAYRLEKTM